MLTGKCKKDFEKWLYNNIIYCNVDDVYNWFLGVPQSMQYGVYIDFFDSLGIEISISFYSEILDVKSYYQFDIDEYFSKEYKTRSEAREEAIKKANEIYNKR